MMVERRVPGHPAAALGLVYQSTVKEHLPLLANKFHNSAKTLGVCNYIPLRLNSI